MIYIYTEEFGKPRMSEDEYRLSSIVYMRACSISIRARY